MGDMKDIEVALIMFDQFKNNKTNEYQAVMG